MTLKIKSWAESIKEATAEIRKYQLKEKTPFSTQIPHFDSSCIGGIYPGDCIVIGGLPSHGKSFLLTEVEEGVLDYAEKTGQKVALLRFNLEMSVRKILMRELRKGTGLKMSEILLKSPVDKEKFNAVYLKQVHRTNVFHCEMPPDDKEFEKIVRQFVEDNKDADLILVSLDHIALAKADADIKRVIDKIMASVISLKMEFKSLLSFIILSQLNRDIEARTGKEEFPRLSDFYMSSTMSHAADIMIAVVNPQIMGKAKYGSIHIKDNPQLENFYAGKPTTQGFTSLETKNNVYYHYLKLRMPDTEEFVNVFGKNIRIESKEEPPSELTTAEDFVSDMSNEVNDANWVRMRSNQETMNDF